MATRRRRQTHRSGGHTLWEVLFVLTLLGAVAALAAPVVALVRQPTDDLTRTTREIAQLLEDARLVALARGTTVEVRLDPSRGQAWVFTVEGDSLQLLATSSFSHVSAVDIGGGESRVSYSFTPLGEAFGKTLEVRGASGTQRILADPWTGAGGIHVAPR